MGSGSYAQDSSSTTLNQANKITLKGLTLIQNTTNTGLLLTSCKESTFEDLKINLKDQTRIIPCVSRQNGTKYKRVTDFLNNENLSVFEEFYLCGNRSMITDSIEILQKKNISTNNIYMETYF